MRKMIRSSNPKVIKQNLDRGLHVLHWNTSKEAFRHIHSLTQLKQGDECQFYTEEEYTILCENMENSRRWRKE